VSAFAESSMTRGAADSDRIGTSLFVGRRSNLQASRGRAGDGTCRTCPRTRWGATHMTTRIPCLLTPSSEADMGTVNTMDPRELDDRPSPPGLQNAARFRRTGADAREVENTRK
jgi:hypothetical protein